MLIETSHAEANPPLPYPAAFNRVSKRVPVRLIIEAGAEYLRVPVSQILSPSRRADAVEARMIITYVARGMTGQSLPQLGRMFTRDHTTLLHAINNAEQLYATDQAFRHRVDALCGIVERLGDINVKPDADPFSTAREIMQQPNLAIMVSVEAVHAMAAVIDASKPLVAEVERLGTGMQRLNEFVARAEALDAEIRRKEAKLAAINAKSAACDIVAAARAWLGERKTLDRSLDTPHERAARRRVEKAEITLLTALEKEFPHG